MEQTMLAEQVLEWKGRRNAVILAHNYQEGRIQDVADFTGDSLKLAQFAVRTDAEVILFCGVHFMAETAAMLCPDRKVIVPDLAAGCSLADMIMPGQVRKWKQQHRDGVAVCYINTAAAVKAECDYCCTSANGEQVINAIPADKEILFVPDFYLGSYLKAKTGRNIELWKGYCPAHAVIDPAHIEKLQEQHPDAEFLMHPECGCLTKQMDLADKILSTDGMMKHVKESGSKRFIIATENGILYRMRKENPDKIFLPASEHATCSHMQQNTLEKVLRSLITLEYPVTVEPAIARRAILCIERMMEISQPKAEVVHGWLDPEPHPVRWGDPVLAAANDLS
ncbi:MAG: quinolinate synthase NadA [Candidatus Omnitrophota bacterium]|nr:quinolinate synthase NadA [Candidatus Omnitrophota bacterium]